jgi:hypothetical protein
MNHDSMSIDEQYEELMNDPKVSDDEIAEFEQTYYRNRRPPRPPLRKKSGSNIVAFLLLVLVAVIAAGVGVFVWSSKTPSGTVTTNPTADAMNTEASVILTQVVSGSSSAIMAGSTAQPTPQVNTGSIPQAVCGLDTIAKKDAINESYYVSPSKRQDIQTFLSKQQWDTLSVGQQFTFCYIP